MPKYLNTNATAKAGINYVKTIVEAHNCIFQKIDQENDVGIDALIELVKNENPSGDFIATQIKSGSSYFDKKSNQCKIPLGSHRQYWQNHALPVYGIVFIPEFKNAYWINIKNYLNNHPSDNVISFEPSYVNILNHNTFETRFVPLLTGEIPKVSYELAQRLFESNNQDEMYLGLHTLFKLYANKNEVWDRFVEYFLENTVSKIPGRLIYYLSVIPWHPDIFYFKDSYTEESREYGKTIIKKFQKEEVLKLLYFVDRENMISRGSLGQSVEAIISIIPNFIRYLKEIIQDDSIGLEIKEAAAVIFAYHRGPESAKILQPMMDESWFFQEIVHHIKEYGSYDPYI